MPDAPASGHHPVLLAEVMEGLRIDPRGVYVDATFGRGGHSAAILERLGSAGRLIALDRDPEAIDFAAEHFAGDPRLVVICSPFSSLSKEVEDRFGDLRVHGVLFDLGVSSPQLDESRRGFSFLRDGPLDMRMDRSGVTAANWLASVPASDLAAIIRELGEERYARRIAAAIATARDHHPITTTKQLADIIVSAVPSREPGKHPATRTFQAIRMTLNRELEELKSALPQAVELLRRGGRLAVISFHSLEDRVCKRYLRSRARGDDYPVDLPVRAGDLRPVLRLVGRAIRPAPTEIAHNVRSRSATLRVAEKL